MSFLYSLRASVGRYPALKSLLKIFLKPFRSKTSSNYAELDGTSVIANAKDLKNAWTNSAIPEMQRIGVNEALVNYRNGKPILDFDVMVSFLQTIVLVNNSEKLSLLEVGCSSGYYSEAFAIKSLEMIYSGCDYSAAFIAMALSHYPSLNFQIEDATALTYENQSFDVVMSGCCLLHIASYEIAISEASRIAKKYVVFHKTPVFHKLSTIHFTKLAYGIKTLEIHFNEHELLSLFYKYNLRIIDIVTLSSDWRKGDAFAVKTYICEKL